MPLKQTGSEARTGSPSLTCHQGSQMSQLSETNMGAEEISPKEGLRALTVENLS
jgi:hypothetical protein